MEITSKLSVTSEQIASLEMHSVINILSVISGQLQLIQMETENQDLIEPVIDMSKTLADSCSSKDTRGLTLESLREFRKAVRAGIKSSTILLSKKRKTTWSILLSTATLKIKGFICRSY
ncbi:MAG: hypothetical protein RI575_01565 [Balneolaceae bacterium]|nr:hypothetical protein [Balneolaceae bacterium]MDR9407779.1 hypothetical protein [Balneolaceae bacterium]